MWLRAGTVACGIFLCQCDHSVDPTHSAFKRKKNCLAASVLSCSTGDLRLVFGMWDLWLWRVNSYLRYVGSSSLTRDCWTQESLNSIESLDHQGNPLLFCYSLKTQTPAVFGLVSLILFTECILVHQVHVSKPLHSLSLIRIIFIEYKAHSGITFSNCLGFVCLF